MGLIRLVTSLEQPREACVTSCGHQFCQDELTTVRSYPNHSWNFLIILQWMQRNPDRCCPTCKQPCLTPADLIPISERSKPPLLSETLPPIRELSESPLSSDRSDILERTTSASTTKETETDPSSALSSAVDTRPPYSIPFSHLRQTRLQTSSPSRFGSVSNWLGHAFTIAAFAIFLFALFPSS